MQHHAQIRSVLPFSKHLHGNALVERIDQVLLDALVFFVIERVDLYDLTENFLIISTNLRNRICNDRKTSLITFDVSVYDLSGFIVKFCLKLLLCLA